MFRFLSEDWKLLKKGGRNMLLFELAYKMIAVAVVYPFLILVLNLVMKMAGRKYLTNQYVVKFLSNPIVIVILIVLIGLFCLYTIYELIFISTCYEFGRRGLKISFIESIVTSGRKFRKLLHIRSLPSFIFVFISIISMNIAVIISTIMSGSTSNMINIYLRKSHWTSVLVAAFLIIAIYIPVILGTFTMNIFVLEETSFRRSYQKSIKMVRKNLPRVLTYIVLYNLFMLVMIGALYVLISAILIAGVKILDMAYIGSAYYLSVLRIIRGGIRIFSVCIAVPFGYTTISRLYYKLCNEHKIDYEPVRLSSTHLRRNRIIFLSLMTVSILLNLTYTVMAFNMNPFDKVALFSEVQVTAHRGSSKDAPENTMAAFERAVIDMADYIELDVQQTKDGEIIVMHDSNVFRLTGIDRNIYDMTLEEVKELDVGSYFSNEFQGEKVPTLEEVLKFAKSKVKLNIEIKPNSYDNDIEGMIVDLINQYNFKRDCIITSFNYNTLKKIKMIDKDIETGYILSVAYGDFYNMEDVDIFSVNASFLTKRTVDSIHKSGKQVHAWTINSAEAVKNLANKGVDNIITDTPLAAKEVVYSRNTSETIVNMIKYVFNK